MWLKLGGEMDPASNMGMTRAVKLSAQTRVKVILSDSFSNRHLRRFT